MTLSRMLVRLEDEIEFVRDTKTSKLMTNEDMTRLVGRGSARRH
jgi:hypothetical protein